ncbi:MAG TPA: histidinol dehydrogenase, partial [Anaerolineales bacterium]|nr:histidinol dehydrogenase [Anaerolineales bacterium]
MHYIKRPNEQGEEVGHEIRETVTRIIAEVEKEGMVAVRRYSEQFDRWSPPSFRVSPETIERAYADMEIEVEKQAQFLIDQVTNFATLQRATL